MTNRASIRAASSLFALSAGLGTNAAIAQDTIVVSGQRAQQAAAIAAKRSAPGIIDVAASDEIGRLPDRNVAEVIERLPGVGVQYDQGEGRFVSVRGVPSALNGYTLNGFEIGNPDGDSRALPLDVISGQLLNRVEVHKVKTPDLLGQGIGGTINLVPQTAFDFDKPIVAVVNASVGYQELREGSHPVRGDATIGGVFGDDDQFGLLVGGSYSDRTFTSFGFFPDDWFPVAQAARGGMPENIKYTDYRLNRERIGLSGSLDWRGAELSLYLRGVYSRFTEDEYRQRFRLDFSEPDLVEDGSVTFDAGGVTGISTDTEQRSDLRLEFKEKSILSGMAGGSWEAEGWQLDFGAALSHNEVIEPNQTWQFRGNPGDVRFDFSEILYTAEPVDGPLAPSDLGFRSYGVQDETGEEDIFQARADLTVDIGESSAIRAGANYRTIEKEFDDESISYGRNSNPNRFTLAGLAGDNVTVFPKDGRGYLIAPVIDEDLIRAFTEQNLFNSQLFVRDDEDTLADQVLSDFVIEEDILAGYVMADLDFGMVAITGGLRVEHTDIESAGFTLENGTTVVPATQEQDYTDWLPSVVARIMPSDDVIVRLAYSRTVGRPNYEDLSPGGSLSFVPLGNGNFEGSLSMGNASLKPYRADNADISLEWYPNESSLVSLAGFAKWIDDPIFGATDVLTDTQFGNRFYEELRVSQPQNATSGEIYGVEFAVQHQFTYLPGLLSGFGVNANVTYVDSTLEVPGRVDSDFPEQPEWLFGVQLFYQQGPVEASLGYNHTGRALIGISGNPIRDEYNDDLRRLDAKISFDISDNFRIFAQGQNLTDEPTRQYQGGNREWIIQRERYGRVFWLGATARL